jgi:hypothetical protein
MKVRYFIIGFSFAMNFVDNALSRHVEVFDELVTVGRGNVLLFCYTCPNIFVRSYMPIRFFFLVGI